MKTDETLFTEFRSGLDENGFKTLMDRYFDPGYSFARGMLSDPTAAEDAVQETFLRTIRARGTFDPRKPFRVWFYHILRNCCIDELRRRKGVACLAGEVLRGGRLEHEGGLARGRPVVSGCKRGPRGAEPRIGRDFAR